VGFLHSLHVLRELNIVVVSVDGWSWVLAWAQLGVCEVTCLPLNPWARSNLTGLQEALVGELAIIHGSKEHFQSMLCRPDPIVYANVGKILAAELEGILAALGPDVPVMISAHPKACKHVCAALQGLTFTEVLCHRRLGGLTSAQIAAIW